MNLRFTILLMAIFSVKAITGFSQQGNKTDSLIMQLKGSNYHKVHLISFIINAQLFSLFGLINQLNES